MDMSTADHIIEMITEHFEYIERDWADLPLDEWGPFLDFPMGRYGWTFPEIGMFCTALIAQQTAHLDDGDLEDYLRAILWCIDRHVVEGHVQPDLTAMERHRIIESELYDKAPASMTLMSMVQLQALDNS